MTPARQVAGMAFSFSTTEATHFSAQAKGGIFIRKKKKKRSILSVQKLSRILRTRLSHQSTYCTLLNAWVKKTLHCFLLPAWSFGSWTICLPGFMELKLKTNKQSHFRSELYQGAEEVRGKVAKVVEMQLYFSREKLTSYWKSNTCLIPQCHVTPGSKVTRRKIISAHFYCPVIGISSLILQRANK